MGISLLESLELRGCAVSALVSFLATWILRPIMRKLGVLDLPTLDRKKHKKPIPYEGGLALYLGFVVGVITYALQDKNSLFWLEAGRAILIGATASTALGALDDVMDLRPWAKLLGQLGIGALMYFYGFRIERISNPLGSEVNILGLVSFF